MTANSFETLCIEECTKLFEVVPNWRPSRFEEVAGKWETYFKATITGPGGPIDVYIYEDEAGYMVEGDNWAIFEKPDYSSPAQLIQAFVSGLKSELRMRTA